MIWNSVALSEALNIEISANMYANQVQFNSQDVKLGDLFIALDIGIRNGHDYAIDAFEKGASVIITSKKIASLPQNKTIIVNDTYIALQKLAKYKRQKSQAFFIGITGSVGKTSTKDALKIVLDSFKNMQPVFASRGNFNNYLGMLINLASMPNDTKYAIFEMGMNHSGEIKELSKILKPNIAIITNISEAHLGFFNSLQEIIVAKCEIFDGLKADGVAVISDTIKHSSIIPYLKDLPKNQVYNFGSLENSNARLIAYEHLGEKVHLKYIINNILIEAIIPTIPKHYAENYAGVLLVSSFFNRDLQLAAKSLQNIPITKGRGEIINLLIKDKNCRIICDHYNASPASVKAALLYLKQIPANSKTAIIGEMLELGNSSRILHENLVPLILASGCSKIFLIGPNTKYIYDLLPEQINKSYFDNVDMAVKPLANIVENEELILLKGSRGVKLEKIINYYL